MLSVAERHKYILDHLNKYGFVRITDVANELGVTKVTIRKDVKILEAKGLLYKVHGSARSANPHVADTDVHVKGNINRDEKERIARARRIRHVALDMDGTIYMGMSLFPWTKRFLSDLTEMGIGYSFLTNNPSKNIADYLHKLDVLGIRATRDEMYTTALATIDYIREHYPAAKRLFLLGTPSMISEFEAAGFESAADSADDVPDVVVAAFDMTLQYDRLCRAAWWVSQGVPYIATNPDRVCPTDQPTVLVDCGSICACIEHATGRRPDITLGKPDPNMLSGILSRHGLQPDQIAMVGDRIYTDVAMAHNAKAMGVLVLSGETTLDVADKADPQPHITADSIEVLGALIREAHSK